MTPSISLPRQHRRTIAMNIRATGLTTLVVILLTVPLRRLRCILWSCQPCHHHSALQLLPSLCLPWRQASCPPLPSLLCQPWRQMSCPPLPHCCAYRGADCRNKSGAAAVPSCRAYRGTKCFPHRSAYRGTNPAYRSPG
jgi:hypothetical protein